MRITCLPINNVMHEVEHLPVSPKAEKVIAGLPLGSPGLSALLFAGKQSNSATTTSSALSIASGAPMFGQLAGKLTGPKLASILGSPNVTVPLLTSWQNLVPVTAAATGVAFDLTKTLRDAVPRGTEVPFPVDGLGVLVAGSSLWHPQTGLPHSESKFGLSSLAANADLALEGVRAALDAVSPPPGVDVPLGMDFAGALIAAISLARGQSGTATRDEKILFYSSNICDIASLMVHVVPALEHSLGTTLGVIGFVLKSSQKTHTFSVTPQPGTAMA